MSAIAIVFSVILVALTYLYLYIKKKYNYWKKKNVPYLEPTLFFGNYKDYLLQKECLSVTIQNLCKKLPNEPFIGAYLGTTPVLLIQDPEMIKLVTTKEFHHFSSRALMDYVHKETLGRSLLLMYGDDWKFTRTNLTPMFSTLKLKNMFHLVEKCADEFENYLDTDIKDKPVEVRRLMAKFTMFCFVSCAFGVDLKDYSKENEFLLMGDRFFYINTFRAIYLNARLLWPGLFYAFGLKSIPDALTNFFRKLLTEVFESRNYKPSARNDFVDALLHLKETIENNNQKVENDYLIAQCLAIFAGGFETSATTMSHVLYELAKHEDIQEKVHKEIDQYLKKTSGKITFECISDLPYLDACMDEALRKYPILGVLTREVTQNYTLPSGIVLERGLRIQMPMYHIHHNPKFFPDPEKFQPERFYGENKQDILPYTYLPFGEGPRFCIGKRFAKMQSLSGLITVLRNRKVVLADGMPTELEFEPKTLLIQSKCGINLRFVART